MTRHTVWLVLLLAASCGGAATRRPVAAHPSTTDAGSVACEPQVQRETLTSGAVPLDPGPNARTREPVSTPLPPGAYEYP